MNLTNLTLDVFMNNEPTMLVSECVKYNSYLVDEMLKYKILSIVLVLLLLIKFSIEIYKNKKRK